MKVVRGSFFEEGTRVKTENRPFLYGSQLVCCFIIKERTNVKTQSFKNTVFEISLYAISIVCIYFDMGSNFWPKSKTKYTEYILNLKNKSEHNYRRR